MINGKSGTPSKYQTCGLLVHLYRTLEMPYSLFNDIIKGSKNMFARVNFFFFIS